MPIRAVLWLAGFGGLCLLALFHPMFGALAYLLDYFQHPPLRWWGAGLPDLRWSLLAACLWLAGYLIRGHSLLDRRILGHGPTWFLLFFILVAALVTPFAHSPAQSIVVLEDLAKLALLFFLIVGTIRTEGELRYFLLAMVVGGFIWGWDAWTDPKRTGGRLQQVGGSDSLHDNAAASVLMTLLPIIGLGILNGKNWERVVLLGCAPFILNAIVLCNSRGTTVACGAAGMAMFILAPGRVRLWVSGLMGAGLVCFFLLSVRDPTFFERQLTIADYEEDGSAMERIETWKGGMRLIRENPLGVGGDGFLLLSPKYIPEVVERHGGINRSAHNTYLDVASDWGIPGFIGYFGFLAAAVWKAHRMRRIPGPLGRYALALEVSIIGFAVNAFFTNRASGEIPYWLCALVCVLGNLTREAPAEAPAPQAAPMEVSPCRTS